MSNIANQVVAVVATLLGFIAHDFLMEAKTATNNSPVVVAAAANVDPIVTRSVALGNLSLDSQCSTAGLETASIALERTPVRMTKVTGARLMAASGARPNPGPAPAERSAAYLR